MTQPRDWSRRYVGIDPGQTGGIAVLRYLFRPLEGCWQATSELLPWPASFRLNGTSPFVPKESGETLRSWIKACKDAHQIACEVCTPRPGYAAKSLFHFGLNVGWWFGFVAHLERPIKLVYPQEWMGHYGFIGKGKNFIADRAQAIFGDMPKRMADAIMIAHWAFATDPSASLALRELVRGPQWLSAPLPAPQAT